MFNKKCKCAGELSCVGGKVRGTGAAKVIIECYYKDCRRFLYYFCAAKCLWNLFSPF